MYYWNCMGLRPEPALSSEKEGTNGEGEYPGACKTNPLLTGLSPRPLLESVETGFLRNTDTDGKGVT